jgi:hypothetical protein
MKMKGDLDWEEVERDGRDTRYSGLVDQGHFDDRPVPDIGHWSQLRTARNWYLRDR